MRSIWSVERASEKTYTQAVRTVLFMCDVRRDKHCSAASVRALYWPGIDSTAITVSVSSSGKENVTVSIGGSEKMVVVAWRNSSLDTPVTSYRSYTVRCVTGMCRSSASC